MDNKQDTNKTLSAQNEPRGWYPLTCIGSPIDLLEAIAKPRPEFKSYSGNPPWAGKKNAKKAKK